MPSININGTEHEVTVDEWGIRYIDGKTIDNFMNTLSGDDLLWAAELGLKLNQEDPERVKDIHERYEISE